MKCPTCTTVDLVMSERQGIEIDYCPTCRGVWLDRGELDKIIERTMASQPAPAGQPQPAATQPQAQAAAGQFFGRRADHGHDDHHDDHHGYGKHGKRSFLKDLFD